MTCFFERIARHGDPNLSAMDVKVKVNLTFWDARTYIYSSEDGAAVTTAAGSLSRSDPLGWCQRRSELVEEPRGRPRATPSSPRRMALLLSSQADTRGRPSPLLAASSTRGASPLSLSHVKSLTAADVSAEFAVRGVSVYRLTVDK